ncbi:MAG: invasion associated locus B family protein, partial [Notoacmeibacter sp.]
MKRLNLTLSFFAATVAVSVTAGAAFAQSSGRTGQFEAWGTYVYQQSGKKTCYILAAPIPNSMKPATVD